jgi:hypothetical protein
MNKRLILTVLSCLAWAGAGMAASDSAVHHDNWTQKGYITVSGSVVVVPERLKSGDQIELYCNHGERVMQYPVADGYLSMDFMNLPSGLYDVVINRDEEVITAQPVPIAGRMER